MTPRGRCHPCLESLVLEKRSLFKRCTIQATNIILDLKNLEIAMLNKEKVKLISVAYFIDSVYPKYYHVTDIKMINQIFWILF